MVVGITRVKNEADIIEATISRMLRQVDHVLVMDGSTDETTEILEALPVTLIRDETPTYEQPQQMTALAHQAREFGAEWILGFDADEVWLSTEGRIADRLAELPDEALLAPAPLFNHVVTALDDPDDPDPVSRIQWRRPEPVPLPKVACRAREDLTIHFGQHGASFSEVRHPLSATGVLQVKHYPYRSVQQLVNKIRVGGRQLVESNIDKSLGAHWRGFYETLERDGERGLESWFARWAYSADPENDPELVHDPCELSA